MLRQRGAFVKTLARKNYDTFRRNFERLMQSGILGTEAGGIMREQIRPFDERFAWTLER